MIRMSPVVERLALTIGLGTEILATCGFEIG